jgi:hypothetical protein
MHEAFFDQTQQSLVEDVARDPEALLELVEPSHAQEGVAYEEHRPPLARHLEALRNRAVHVGEALPFHARSH